MGSLAINCRSRYRHVGSLAINGRSRFRHVGSLAINCRSRFRRQARKSVLPINMVYVVGSVVWVVYPFPAKGQLVVLAVLGPLLLDPRQPGVQPVGGS